jgi:hypothetical protein
LALQAAGVALPQPTSGLFLVDTGASQTVIDTALLSPLGLVPTGSVPIHTPSTGTTPQNCNQYDVMLLVPPQSAGQMAWVVEAMPAIESDFSAQSIHGLIGRDLLGAAVLVYNGPAGHFTLAY